MAEALTRSTQLPTSLKTIDDFFITHGPEITLTIRLPFEALSTRLRVATDVPTSIAVDEVHTPTMRSVVAENRICGVPPKVINVARRKNKPRSSIFGMYRSSCASAIDTQSVGIADVASPGELHR